MSTVMVVDDDPDVLATLSNILKSAGYTVVEAGNGIEALNTLDKGEPLDLLVTDIIMPGLNGFNLARMARSRRPKIKILYLTGWFQTSETMLDQGEKYGKILTKPLMPDDLRREIVAALAAGRPVRGGEPSAPSAPCPRAHCRPAIRSPACNASGIRLNPVPA
jgi:CheY-like chemotaxis protein